MTLWGGRGVGGRGAIVLLGRGSDSVVGAGERWRWVGKGRVGRGSVGVVKGRGSMVSCREGGGGVGGVDGDKDVGAVVEKVIV